MNGVKNMKLACMKLGATQEGGERDQMMKLQPEPIAVRLSLLVLQNVIMTFLQGINDS